MENQYFSLYSFAIPVKGEEQSIICNLYNAGYVEIPQFLCEILLEYRNSTIKNLESLYSDTNGIIRKHFDFLVVNNLGTFTNRLDAFPLMKTEWFEFALIKSAAIRIDNLYKLDYKGLLNKLISLGCRYLEVWYMSEADIDGLLDWLRGSDGSIIRSIDIFMPFSKESNKDIYFNMHKSCSKINNIYLYKAPFKKDFENEKVFFNKNDVTLDKYSKNVPFDEYIIYSEFFIESMHRNPYYNNKVCIDQYGSIKNCFQHKRSFGNIEERELSDIVASEEFQEMWFACNDRVVEIKDSPFRYIWLNTYEVKSIGEGLYSIIT